MEIKNVGSRVRIKDDIGLNIECCRRGTIRKIYPNKYNNGVYYDVVLDDGLCAWVCPEYVVDDVE